MAALGLGQVGQELAHIDVGRPLGGLRIEARGLQLHDLGLLAGVVEPQPLRQPDGAPLQEAAHVGAGDMGQVLAELGLEGFEQDVAVTPFLLRHLLEHLGRTGELRPQLGREVEVDARILLFIGHRERQHLALGQFGEVLHRGLFGTIPI